jgi:hypothetical protein
LHFFRREGDVAMPKIKTKVIFTDDYEERFIKSLVAIAEKKFTKENLNTTQGFRKMEVTNERRARA